MALVLDGTESNPALLELISQFLNSGEESLQINLFRGCRSLKVSVMVFHPNNGGFDSRSRDLPLG